MTQKVPQAMIDETKFADIASAGTVDLDVAAGAYGQITGTTNITAITLSEGRTVWARFTGVLTLTNGASLVLPGAANITTAAGDWALFAKVGSVVYCLFYSKVSGSPLNINNTLGTVVQVQSTQTGAVATGTTIIPFDDTIPQNTEGDQYMSLAITPKATTNKLKIDVVIVLASSLATNQMAAALFQDSTANALAAAIHSTPSSGGHPTVIKFTHYMTAGTISATTFKVRGGAGTAATTTFNGSGGARLLGGVMASSITITEIAA